MPNRQEHVSDGQVKGNFDAKCAIGFQIINFDYVSKVTYRHPAIPIQLSRDHEWYVSSASASSIFKLLQSEWKIKHSGPDLCSIDYSIQMEFANSLYSQITRQFFDYLVSSVNT